jgi:hypothetical protein
MKSHVFPRLFALVLLVAATGCGAEQESVPAEESQEAFQTGDTAELANARGWRVDTRVLSQVGVFFGRNGSGTATSPSAYRYVGQLSLPAGALIGNAIPLFDTRPDDIAQIDFYRLHAERSGGLAEMLRGYVGELVFGEDVQRGLRGALAPQSVLLKEVRLRGPADAPLAPALSVLPANAFGAFERVNYMSVFVTKPKAGGTAQAIDAFRASVSAGGHAYEVGDVAPLPRIPHPQNAAIALLGLMTVRLIDPLHGRRLVLEVLETE